MISTNRNTSNGEDGDKSEMIPLKSLVPTENADKSTSASLAPVGESKGNRVSVENVSARGDGVR